MLSRSVISADQRGAGKSLGAMELVCANAPLHVKEKGY